MLMRKNRKKRFAYSGMSASVLNTLKFYLGYPGENEFRAGNFPFPTPLM